MGDSKHPADEDLEKYAMKMCSDQETEQIEEHLLVCDSCRVRFESSEEWVALMKSALQMGPKRVDASVWRQVIHRIVSRPFALAAFAIFAVAIAIGVPYLLREPRGEEQLVVLTATRGDGKTLTPPSSHNWLKLSVDSSGLTGPLDAEIVDSQGRRIWQRAVDGSRSPLAIERKLPPGIYWVRLNSRAPESRTLREFQLRVE